MTHNAPLLLHSDYLSSQAATSSSLRSYLWETGKHRPTTQLFLYRPKIPPIFYPVELTIYQKRSQKFPASSDFRWVTFRDFSVKSMKTWVTSLCHWWHKQLWRLTISTPRKSESFSTWRIEKGNFVCIDTRQYKLYQANKSKKMIVKFHWHLRLPSERGLRRFFVVFKKSYFFEKWAKKCFRNREFYRKN